MKILMINSVCGIRSTGKICTDLANELEHNGHEVKIAYGRESVPERFQKYAVRIGNNIDVKLHALKARFIDASGFGSKRATKKFIRWVKEYDPDIIHLHNLHGYYINIEVLFNYLKDSGKPIVWTLHDCWTFTGHCAHFELINCSKWKNQCENCCQTKNYPKSFIFDNSRRNYQLKKKLFTSMENLTIVTPSYWLANLVRESFLGDNEIEVINNGIDTNVFKPTAGDFRAKYNLENKKIILGVASAWGKNKGLYDFVKLSEMLDDEFKVVLVGLTKEQQKKMPPQILGITRTDSVTQLAEIYTAADFFVNPTYQDTYPTVNLEAQACGTPVITYRTGGSVESVPAEQTINPGDLTALCQMLKTAGNYKITNANFSSDHNFRNHMDLYERKVNSLQGNK